MDNNKIIIYTLGEFSISCGDVTITEKLRRSKKMWTLLKYLITFRGREVSQNEMIELLWADGESGNPAGALKTQLHRLRTVLQGLPLDEELIINASGTYAFNASLDYWIDTEEFERLFKLSGRAEISEKERVSYLQRAFELYKGDFLHKSSTEKWVMPINVYYHSVFLRITHKLTDILYKHRQFSELTNVCKKAIMIDSLDHKSHYNLIKAFTEMGERQAAKKHYYYVIDLFYNRQGINPPPELISLYEEIIKSEESFETDMSEVKRRLGEKDEYAEEKRRGAFFCELEFFKYVYHLEIRDAERTGREFQLCLLTVKESGGVPGSEVLGKAMQNLFESISKSLRASDIFARYSASQFIIMLPSADEKNTELIMKRIIRNYRAENPKSGLDIEYQYNA